MHDIKRHILKKLTLAKRARYAELKPSAVEGNMFVYHLQNLIKEGYVVNEGRKYSLTAHGRRFVDRMSFETFRERIQPKIVTIIVLEEKGKYLFYRRRLVPFKDRVGFPYGKIHLEERVKDAAERELREKTGLSAELTHRGDVYLTVHDDTELVAHMLCHVFSGKKTSGTLLKDSLIGECFWARLQDIPQNTLIPGVRQIDRLLSKSRNFFFAEYFLGAGEE